MKRFVIPLSIVVGVWAWSPTLDMESLSVSSSSAQAWGGKNSSRESRGGWYPGKWLKIWFTWKTGKGGGKNGGATGVPELDPGSAGAAMVLLLGGTAYLASRRRDEELV